MKNVLLASVFVSVFSASAQATINAEKKVKFVGDMAYAGFCQAIVDDNVSLFKRSIRRFVGPLGGTREEVLEKVLENDNVKCAGEGIAKFAQERNATQVSGFISNVSA